MIMKRKKALKKQLKRLMQVSEGFTLPKEQEMITDAIVKVAQELRKGKKG